jgi:hypothetical protein
MINVSLSPPCGQLSPFRLIGLERDIHPQGLSWRKSVRPQSYSTIFVSKSRPLKELVRPMNTRLVQRQLKIPSQGYFSVFIRTQRQMERQKLRTETKAALKLFSFRFHVCRDHGHTARDGHKVLLRLAMPYPSTPSGRPPLEQPYGRAGTLRLFYISLDTQRRAPLVEMKNVKGE